MKIGIITMHNVQNYGSALQTFALQHTLESNGFDCEIIDYRLDRKKKNGNKIIFYRNVLIALIKDCVTGFSHTRSQKKFSIFYRSHLRISGNSYDRRTIDSALLGYDVYMTGSDQVWNPKHIRDDVNYFLAFAPMKAPKISYASSFATTSLDNFYMTLYSKYLAKYNYISVRENTGKDLVKKMVGKEAVVDIDPVLLIGAKDWATLVEESRIKKRKKYILVYALYYMFDPYPELNNIIDHVQKTLGYDVIFLNARASDFLRPNSSIYKAGGPIEFLYLIKNAEFVITTSFHGTAFSAIFDKPIIGIVKGDGSDDRISSLLSNLNAGHSIVAYNEDIRDWDADKLLSLKCSQTMLEQLANLSRARLLNSIKLAINECNRQ